MGDLHTFSPGRTVGAPASVALDHDYFAGTFQFGGAYHLMRGDIRLELSGGHKVGDTLRVKVNRAVSLNLLARDFATQWRRNGRDIPGERGRTYVLRQRDVGKSISCVVTDAAAQITEPVVVIA